MKILLFGKYGQLGWELHRSLQGLGEIAAYDLPEVDFAKPYSLKKIVESERPQIVVNAAAYTDVDKAESEPEKARLINAESPGMLAEACRTQGAALIHYSTDYVFDGRKGAPYTEDDAPNPLNVYGQTKLKGELAILQSGGVNLIFRTAWVYSMRRNCFATKVLAWACQQAELKVVEDQTSNPTSARSLADATAHLIARAGLAPISWLADKKGIFHLAGSGYATRLEWAKEIIEIGLEPAKKEMIRILPSRTAELPVRAIRPQFSALDCDRSEKIFALRLLDWNKALSLAMEDELSRCKA